MNRNNRVRWAGLTAALVMVIAGGAARAQAAVTVNRIVFTGTVGQDRIGMALQINASDKIVGGHFFYAKDLKDIPLQAGTRGTGMILYGPEGGQFALRFKGNGSGGGKPLGFNNSVGLDGRWMKGASSYPVTLRMEFAKQVTPNSRWYEDVTSESDPAFEAKVQNFYSAVLKGDKAAAAGFVDFPLQVNANGKSTKVVSAAQLLAQWEQIFTTACLDAFRNAMPHDMFVRNGQAMLGDGVAWFDGRGVQAINVP